MEVEPPTGPGPTTDDTLHLYFLCAHPSLSPASAVALTLRAVGGLTTRQIATAYLVPEATMAQRITRAKGTIASVQLTRSPVVRLNRAVTLGESDGPQAGLSALVDLDPGLPRYAAVTEYLLERSGSLSEAARQRGCTPRPRAPRAALPSVTI